MTQGGTEFVRTLSLRSIGILAILAILAGPPDEARAWIPATYASPAYTIARSC